MSEIAVPAPATAAEEVYVAETELKAGALGFWGGAGDAMAAFGIAHLADVPVRLLSSGQIKRATLARVAGSGAPLWLLDEPLNALDTDAAERLSVAIGRRLSLGGAVLAASHQPLPGDWPVVELGA